MKQLLIISNSILLGIVLFMACGRNSGQPLALQGDSCLTKACNELRSISAFGAEEKISWRLAKEMSKSYAADAGKNYINNGSSITQIQDALSVTFSLEKLKQIIYLIEQNICKKNCDTIYRMGIRFYFAKYPAVVGPGSAYSDLKTLPADYANKHTLFLTPAYLKNNQWFDFDPFSSRRCPGPGSFDSSKYVLFMPAPGSSTTTDQDNHGGIAPPPDGGTFPTNEY